MSSINGYKKGLPIMKFYFLRKLQLVMIIIASSLAVQAADLENIGNFDFPTSGSPEAQQHFILGVGYLHSFGWKQARDEFRKAQEIEPDFAMAYWGEAFSYNHPLIGVVWEPGASARVLNKLASSTEERLAKAPTEREKGFLRAAEAYAFSDGDFLARRTAWMQAMKTLYDAFPEDREVAAFYAVSLLSGATAAGEQRQRINNLAGSIALELFRENENHPGASHYIIHSFDDPEHAPIALAAALKYATIAPAVAHARHMPTHIFIQHGMWQEVADYNISAFQAAEDLWRPGDRPNDMNHAVDWGQYGHLQLADYDYVRQWIAKAEKVLAQNPENSDSLSILRTMKARFIVESKQWQTSEITADTNAAELLAIGLSAINLNEMGVASNATEILRNMAESRPDSSTINIIYREVAALALFKQGNTKGALDLLDEGIALTNAQLPPRGPVNPAKPVHELYGEILLESGQVEKAIELFTQSLQRTPNRSWSMLGLARSYAAQGKNAQASEQYRKVTQIWINEGLPAYQEALEYLARQGG
jgi:tetratricopeptide (TPR) repeat protein